MLNKRAGKTTLLWIPGHHGIEEANARAKQAAAITDGDPRPVSFAAASALIRRTLTDPPTCHCRTKEVYTKAFSWPATATNTTTEQRKCACRHSCPTTLVHIRHVKQKN